MHYKPLSSIKNKNKYSTPNPLSLSKASYAAVPSTQIWFATSKKGIFAHSVTQYFIFNRPATSWTCWANPDWLERQGNLRSGVRATQLHLQQLPINCTQIFCQHKKTAVSTS